MEGLCFGLDRAAGWDDFALDWIKVTMEELCFGLDQGAALRG